MEAPTVGSQTQRPLVYGLVKSAGFVLSPAEVRLRLKQLSENAVPAKTDMASAATTVATRSRRMATAFLTYIVHPFPLDAADRRILTPSVTAFKSCGCEGEPRR